MTPELLKQIEKEAKRLYPDHRLTGAPGIYGARIGYETGASYYAAKAEEYKKAAETNYNQVMELATLATEQEAEIAALKIKAKGLRGALEEILKNYEHSIIESGIEMDAPDIQRAKQALTQYKL